MAAAVALESLDAPLIDSHCHIVFRNFDDDLEEVAQRWRDAGVGRLLHACVEPSEIPAIRALADRYPELRDDYFGNYRQVVWLTGRGVDPDARRELATAAQEAATALGLPLVVRPVGRENLAAEVESLLP